MLFRRASGTRRAVTLIEAVLFIAVALGLIVGGLVFYQQAQTARQTQEAVRLTQAIVSESRALYNPGCTR
jgi:Tfp pilus assembly protein PilV